MKILSSLFFSFVVIAPWSYSCSSAPTNGTTTNSITTNTLDSNALSRCYQLSASGLDETWKIIQSGNKFTAAGNRFLPQSGDHQQLTVDGEWQADGQAKVAITVVSQNNLSAAQTQYEIWRTDEKFLYITDRAIEGFQGDFKAYMVNCQGDSTKKDTILFDKIDGFFNGYAVAQRKKEFLIINEKEQIVGTIPNEYAAGLGTVCEESIVFYSKKTARYGILDIYGNIIIEPKYDKLHAFNNGLAAFLADNAKWGFMDKKGKIVIKPQYDMLAISDNVPDQHPFMEGLAAVGLNFGEGKDPEWGYIDPSGKLIIPMQFGFANPFKNGEAQVFNDKGKWISIDKKGTCIKGCE